jgi:hypothetical protein
MPQNGQCRLSGLLGGGRLTKGMGGPGALAITAIAVLPS